MPTWNGARVDAWIYRSGFSSARPPNFELKLVRPGSGPPSTPPLRTASVAVSRQLQVAPAESIIGRSNCRAPAASARGTGRTA